MKYKPVTIVQMDWWILPDSELVSFLAYQVVSTFIIFEMISDLHRNIHEETMHSAFSMQHL